MNIFDESVIRDLEGSIAELRETAQGLTHVWHLLNELSKKTADPEQQVLVAALKAKVERAGKLMLNHARQMETGYATLADLTSQGKS